MQVVAAQPVLSGPATLPRVARACSAVVLALAAVVLTGWVLHVEPMTSGLPGLTTQKVNTAACLAALAVSVLKQSKRAAVVASVFVLLVAGLTMVEIIGGVDLGIDQIFATDRTVKPGVPPGQMAPATTVALLALAASRLLLLADRRRRAGRLLFVPMFAATMSLFGYLFGVEQMYRVTALSSVALNTAVSLALLTTALAALIPGGFLPWVVTGTGPGAAIVRGAAPIVAVSLTALGLVRDALVNGEKVGDNFGTAVMAVAGTLVAVVATTATARRFDVSHRARLQAEQALRDLNSSLVEGRDEAWRRAERLATEVEQERSRFERAVANTEDVFWTLETTGGVLTPTYVSPNANLTTGRGTSVGHPFPLLLGPLVVEDDRDAFEAFESDIAQGLAAATEVRVRGVDGRVRWIWLRGSPRHEQEKRYFDGVASNTTERRTLADQRELLLEQARLQVQRLSELTKARQEFTTVAGHELRTPVAVIVGYCEILEDPDVGPEVRDQAIEAIRRRAEQLQDLVQSVFDLAKMDTGSLQLDLEALALAEFTASAVSDYESVAQAAGVDLAYAAGEELEVLADPTRLRQVLDNVLSNAIKFTASGGHVCVRVSGHGGAATVTVADNGIGVPTDELSHIFDRMYRAANAQEAHIPGTGLGLAVTRELVEAMGGGVTADANEPHGLVITVTLPELVPDENPGGDPGSTQHGMGPAAAPK